jgi:Rieske Fe-S protein
VWVVKEAEDRFRVFTTICPHLGCSVNLGENGFACPCHNAKFGLDGVLTDGPAPRGMDTLEWQRNPRDPGQLMVKYQNFKASIAEKQLVGS